MLWVDHESYFGPDRRRKRTMRLRERRRYDCASAPPSLSVALRQLRLRVIDARGVEADAFAERANAVAVLADFHHEREASHELSRLSMAAMRGRHADVRPALYDGLDRVHGALVAA